jgi:hypothetical protein
LIFMSCHLLSQAERMLLDRCYEAIPRDKPPQQRPSTRSDRRQPAIVRSG